MKFIKYGISTIFLIVLIYFLNKPIFGLPAMARFFSPFEGFMQNAESKANHVSETLNLTGVKDEVTVTYDDNMVPHIFAQNEEDLYFTQGYVMAKDRIWQMEFYTLAASGRLSEVVGERALDFDKYNRGLGMAKTAAEIAENLKKDPLSSKIINSFASGVNEYLKTISYKNLPVEYKILGYQPSEWSIYKTILMLMNMRNTLNGGSTDYRLSNVVSKYGIDVANELFTNYPSYESPIVPVGTKWNFTPLPVKSPGTELVPDSKGVLSLNIPEARPEIGSNNWAVAGAKSATGLPILANDPHLTLSLPSIWYQMQLQTPDMNVCGVALPGCPGIVIGFNKDVAWGVTNVGGDVMDFYKIKFKDASRNEYWHDGKWKKATQRIETYKLKSGVVITDTVTYTHHGPIIYKQDNKDNFGKQIPVGHAMRWIAHENTGSDLLAFYYLNKAKNYDDYRKALTYYVAPAQNFIFASNQNDISITPNGRMPLKYKNQGKFILDGSNPEHDWQGYIPADQNPTVKNPPRGFVSSANQFSADPTYPYYLGWQFAPTFRGVRINERLQAMQKATADSLRLLQNDNFNVAARRILPTVFEIMDASADKSQATNFAILKNWNLKNDPKEVGATIFETWMDELRNAIWKDEFNKDDKLMYPSEEKTFEIIESRPDARWFDDINTKDKVETLPQILSMSLKATMDSLTKLHGPMSMETWAWVKVKDTEIKHLVPAFGSFGRKHINNGGGSRIVNATTKNTGPSWRMVVELNKEWPVAYGLYPGGQSGNPGSKYYDNMIDSWAEGKLNKLSFMKNKEDKSVKMLKQTIIKPKK